MENADHPEEENPSARGGGIQGNEGIVLKKISEELNDAGDQEGEEYKQDQGRGIGIR